MKAGFAEQVLLSDVARHKDEAIAITPTALNLAYSRVPHVIVISDACRNAVDPFGPLGTVSGSPAYDRPGIIVGIKKSKVDVFYATTPSQTAKEFKGEGFFTKILLEALTNPPPDVRDVCRTFQVQPQSCLRGPLETYLSSEIPLRAAKESPSFDQTPDFTVTSRKPLSFGYAQAQADTGVAIAREPSEDALETIDLPQSMKDLRIRPHDNPLSKNAVLDRLAVAVRSLTFDPDKLASLVRDAGLTESVDEHVGGERGRQSFETATGYSVVGDEVSNVLLSGGLEGEVTMATANRHGTDVRLYPPTRRVPSGQRGSVVLVFKSGTLSVLPILPGCIGTLHLRDGRLVSRSFEMSAQLSRNAGSGDTELRNISMRRALAAALSSTGNLRRLGRAAGDSCAPFIRMSKRADPTLGIYSAYAYALAGNSKGARSVFDWMRHYRSLWNAEGLPAVPVPFDVAMLAGRLSKRVAWDRPRIAPFCPMMSLGWSVMNSFPPTSAIHDAILAAGKHRLNAEWTTFRRSDVGSMLNALLRGEIK
ncbi:hypothetical protein HZ992_16650 [Rhizobacter sp. AJA081-3]|uniref:hypothetical protein n=1 Tax=Rhizobacter sp. AJA081-3 TaxID=2753607 RepID=UPI001AE0DF46|nr:hypothetical protein [Rhizobacter sp. AJA081-3]QTN21795.1 hypothetical protein HZ992_16650 [Rhizobacter sp. AJA081-3]